MTSKGRDPLDLYPEQGHVDAQDLASAPLTPLEVATFVESMTLELGAMARGARLETLAYFLDMARMEASTQAEQLDPQAPGRRLTAAEDGGRANPKG